MEEYYVEHINSQMKNQGMELFLHRALSGTICAKAHIHESIEILWIQEGHFRIYVNETEYFAEKGDIVLFRSHTIHKIYALESPAGSYYVLKVKPSLFLELASEQNSAGYLLRFVLQDKEEKTCWKATDPTGRSVRCAFESLIREQSAETPCKDISLKLCAGRVLLCILQDILLDETQRGICAHTSSATATQIYKVIRYINENYSNDIDAETCGEMVHMSYSYFSRSFKHVTGKSFKSYLNQVRINQAEKLLATTDRSVTQIASDCGYNNVAYFISVYKSLKGKTPLAERKSVNGDPF